VQDGWKQAKTNIRPFYLATYKKKDEPLPVAKTHRGRLFQVVDLCGVLLFKKILAPIQELFVEFANDVSPQLAPN
jgi:hypothetical protein